MRLFITPHPSPLFINNAPGNRDRILIVLRQVAEFIDQSASGHFDASRGALSTPIERLRKHSRFDEARRAFAAYRAARDKLLELGVIRSERSVAGDYGEWLAAEALGLTLATSGVQAGFDATDADGKTYQIKTRIVRDVNAATSFDIKETSQRFDYLIGVLLSPSCDLLGLLRVPVDEVVKRAARNQGTRRLRWTRNCWDQSWVEVLYRRPIQVISP